MTVDIDTCPKQVQDYLSELLKRHAVNERNLRDKTLLNYLCTQKFDKDFMYREGTLHTLRHTD